MNAVGELVEAQGFGDPAAHLLICMGKLSLPFFSPGVEDHSCVRGAHGRRDAAMRARTNCCAP